MLADANGLGGDDALVAGSTLTVPEVKTSLNDASTFKPYDPGEITGPTTPSLPFIPPPDQGCGQIGVLIMAVVAVVVSVVTYGAASSVMAAWQAGALAGAASSAAGQVVGNMAGIVDGFSFKDIALGAVTGAISAGVSSSLTGGKEGLKASTIFAKVGEKGTVLTGLGRTVTGLASYAGSVAGNKLMGRSSGFSWAGIASTVVGASLSSALGGRIPFMEGGGASEGFWPDFGGGIINGVTTATVDRVFGLGRQNWASIVGSALGTAWGNSINSGPGVGKKVSAPEADRAVAFPLADAQRATVTELPQEAMGGVSGAPQKATAVRSPVAEEVDLSGIDTSDILATLSTVHVTGDERRDSLFMNYWMWSQSTGYRAPNATEDLRAYYRKAGAWVANDPRTVKYNEWSSQSLAAVYSSNGISFNTSIGPPDPYLANYRAINGGIASIFEKAEAPFIALQRVSHDARMNARAWVLESDSSLEAQMKSSFYAWATFGDGLIQAGTGTGRLIANPPQSAAGIYHFINDPGAVWDSIVAMPYEDKLGAVATGFATGGAGLVRKQSPTEAKVAQRLVESKVPGAPGSAFERLGSEATSPWLADPRSGVRMHIESFRDGGSFLIPKSAWDRFNKGRAAIGDTTGQFITTRAAMDKVLLESNGNLALAKQKLGIPERYWNEEILRVDVHNPLLHDARLPSGLERGANEHFRWGGYTNGGQPEVVIDPVPRVIIVGQIPRDGFTVVPSGLR